MQNELSTPLDTYTVELTEEVLTITARMSSGLKAVVTLPYTNPAQRQLLADKREKLGPTIFMNLFLGPIFKDFLQPPGPMSVEDLISQVLAYEPPATQSV